MGHLILTSTTAPEETYFFHSSECVSCGGCAQTAAAVHQHYSPHSFIHADTLSIIVVIISYFKKQHQIQLLYWHFLVIDGFSRGGGLKLVVSFSSGWWLHVYKKLSKGENTLRSTSRKQSRLWSLNVKWGKQNHQCHFFDEIETAFLLVIHSKITYKNTWSFVPEIDTIESGVASAEKCKRGWRNISPWVSKQNNVSFLSPRPIICI